MPVIGRRELMAALGGAAAAAWPLAARAQQQPDQMRRIGVTVFSKDDPEGQRRVAALRQRLQELGWVDGRNVRMELRWAGGDPDRARFYAGAMVVAVGINSCNSCNCLDPSANASGLNRDRIICNALSGLRVDGWISSRREERALIVTLLIRP